MSTVTGTEPLAKLRLVDGCELLGRYESPAFEQPQYLIRRADDQLVRLSEVLYLLASHLDGSKDASEIAEQISADLGRPVSPENVCYLVKHKLRPNGLVAGTGAVSAQQPRARPLLALRFRAKLLPERAHRSVTGALRPLFWPPAVVTVLVGLFGLDVWLFATRGTALFGLTRQVIVHPFEFLLLTGLVMAACVFHEFGHASAARYGGARPGTIGVGLYLAFPVFYTDVTDSYRLDRRGRLRTDLGGVYFNAIAVVAAGVAYFATGFTPLLVFVVVSQLQILYQFLPAVRMDGYYVVSDLIGVPNLFAFVGPVARRLPRRSFPAQGPLRQLKRGARIAITVWVCLTVPILLVNVAFFAAIAPRVLPALWSAAWRQEHLTSTAVEHGAVVQAMNQGIGLLILTATGAGLLLTGGLIVLRLSRLAARSAVPRVLPLICLHTHVLYVSAASLALASFAALTLGFVQGAAPLVLVSIAYSALAALALASFVLANHRGPARPS
jgi:putative peptide zinc metalloprotease protein